MTSLSIRVYDDHLTVDAPYDPVFHDRADELGGIWIPETGMWRFGIDDRYDVARLTQEIYPHHDGGNACPAHELAIARHPIPITGPAGGDPAAGVAGVSVHQRRADLLTRLDVLVAEIVEIHTALRTLT